MSLDLDAIKAKLNQLTTTNDRKNNYFRPEPGKQRVRIVPYVHRKENPFPRNVFPLWYCKEKYALSNNIW